MKLCVFNKKLYNPFKINSLCHINQLPDGRVIKVGTERFQAPEALFTPVSLYFF